MSVNGSPAKFVLRDCRSSRSLPRRRSTPGDDFTVEVDYAGKPKPIKDPDKSVEGFVPTDDGAFVVNEPQGSPAGSR